MMAHPRARQACHRIQAFITDAPDPPHFRRLAPYPHDDAHHQALSSPGIALEASASHIDYTYG
jgi:hypothetical protein